MNTVLWTLLIVAFLPYPLALSTVYFRIRQFGKFDNNHPRAQYADLQGAGARAWAAQQNAWEALGLFTAIALITQLAGADPDKTASAATVFLLTRLLHPVFYIADLSILRSLSVVVGLFSCIYMLMLAVAATAA